MRRSYSRRVATFGLGLVLGLCGCSPASDPSLDATPEPPIAEPRPQLRGPGGADPDPYAWLEDRSRSRAEVRAHLEAENRYAEAWLARLAPMQEQLIDELRRRVDPDETMVWFDRDDRYAIRYAPGGEHPVHVRSAREGGTVEEILVDGAALADASPGLRVIDVRVSPDGRHVAWLQDVPGRPSFQLMLRRLPDGRPLDTGVAGVHSISWAPGSLALHVVERDAATLRPFRVRAIDPARPADGRVIYEESDPAFVVTVGRTRSGEHGLIVLRATDTTEVRRIEVDGSGTQALIPRLEGHRYLADHARGRWVIRTNLKAPNGRLVEVDGRDLANPARWIELVPHDEGRQILEFDVFDGHVALAERVDGQRRLRIVERFPDRAAAPVRESMVISFGAHPHVLQLGRNPDPASRQVQFIYTSMTEPRETWLFDLDSGARERIHRLDAPAGYVVEDYVAERRWVIARDGARVPVSVLRRRDTPLDGTAPLYLVGYGAYGQTLEPAFATDRLSLLDRGFVFALAHVRGGQALGQHWYDQGRGKNKRNAIEDFLAVADHFARAGWADPDRIYAVGSSAGGLLVGAAVNSDPGRFDAVVTHVPFVDVVNTMADPSLPLTAQEYGEWGDPRTPDELRAMRAYSPYDNVRAAPYPPMLVTTGLWDAQVPYWEAVKWVARLRERQTSAAPKVLQIDFEAGHDGRSGRFRALDATAREYAFLLDQAGCAGGAPCAGSD